MKNLITIACLLLLLPASMCLAQQPVAPAVNDSLLLEYYQNQRFQEAHDYLKQAYTEPVTNPKALSQLAYTAQMAGKLNDAEGYYQRLYDIDSSKISVLFSLAGINMKRGNLSKAYHYYHAISLKDSTNFLVYKQLAIIAKDKGDLTLCMNYFEKANKLNPAEPDIAADLSDLYVLHKLFAPATGVLNTAITADPDNTVLLESLVKLNFAQKDWRETVKAGEKLLQANDQPGWLMLKLAQAYYFTKKYTCGIEALASIDEQLQNETSYYFAGVCYKALNDNRHAAFYFSKAIEASVSPAIDSYYRELADTYDKMKELKRAVRTYEKSLEYQSSPLTYYALAALYDGELKDKANAVKYYKKYLAAKPPADQQEYVAFTKSRLKNLAN